MAARLASWWKRCLKTRPVLTNTVVYGSFYTAAEFSQQTYSKYNTPEKPDYDVISGCRIVAVGSTIYPSTLFFWYRYLDNTFKGTAVKTVMTKVCADQLFMTPILLAAFYTILGVLEHREDPLSELKAKFVKSFIWNQTFWFPGQTINFFFVPPHLRVVYVSVLSFVWINVLCFIKRQKIETPIPFDPPIPFEPLSEDKSDI